MEKPEMDEFQAAGFDEEVCEHLRKLCQETGIEPENLIRCVSYQEDFYCSDTWKLKVAWWKFKCDLWNEFENSKIGKLFIRLADKIFGHGGGGQALRKK